MIFYSFYNDFLWFSIYDLTHAKLRQTHFQEKAVLWLIQPSWIKIRISAGSSATFSIVVQRFEPDQKTGKNQKTGENRKTQKTQKTKKNQEKPEKPKENKKKVRFGSRTGCPPGPLCLQDRFLGPWGTKNNKFPVVFMRSRGQSEPNVLYNFLWIPMEILIFIQKGCARKCSHVSELSAYFLCPRQLPCPWYAQDENRTILSHKRSRSDRSPNWTPKNWTRRCGHWDVEAARLGQARSGQFNMFEYFEYHVFLVTCCRPFLKGDDLENLWSFWVKN